MITIKNVALWVLLLCASVALSSCEDQMDTMQQDRSASFDVSTRSERSANGLSVSPQGGLVSEDQFSFDFSTTNSVLAKDDVQLYVIFTAPNGGDYPVLMNKSVSGNWVSASLQKTLSQVGTYKVQVAYSVNGGSKSRIDNQVSVVLTSDRNDFPEKKGQCVTWVYHKIDQMWGSRFYRGLGSATAWRDRLAEKGYVSDLNPQVGDIAWWKKTNSTNGHLGHVAFVYQVIDNNTVKISEYNYPGGLVFSKRTLYRNTSRVSEKFPTAFIHVQSKK